MSDQSVKVRLWVAHAGLDPVALVQLCRDAHREIERLEQSPGKTVSQAREVEALEQLVRVVEKIESTLGSIDQACRAIARQS